MAEDFKVRRDSSTNNVPTVGYNEGVDAQDVILFGACKITETLTADGTGKVTLTHQPVSLTGATFTDTSGVRRGRNLNDDITVASVGGTTTYYAGSISPVDKTLKVYTNSSRTSVISGGSVVVTYYRRVPIKINENGELVIEGQSTDTQDVNITNASIPVTVSETLPVSIQSSEVSLAEKEKVGIMLKKETTIAAGASATEIPIVVGDNTKDMYITNLIAYYNGTGEDTDPYVAFYFDQVDAEGTSTGWMDMLLPPKVAHNMMQLDFGPTGVKIPANGKFRFRTTSTWVQNYIHVCAYGWQYKN